MNTLRINLHIRDDISPLLYKALINLPGKPRAEYLRNLAEKGLISNVSRLSTKLDASEPVGIDGNDHSENHFADDLLNLIAKNKKENNK